MRVVGVVALVLVGILTGCTSASGPAAGHVSKRVVRSDLPLGPQPLTLRRPEGLVELYPWHACSSTNGCWGADHPPDDPPLTAAEGSVAFSFPQDGWVFEAAFTYPGAGRCGRTAHESLEAGDDGTYVVAAPGAAGTWDVTVSGRSDEGGSLMATFRWTTAASDPGTDVVGDLTFLWPQRGVTSPPVLTLRGLAEDPPFAEAELTLPDHPDIAPYVLHLGAFGCPGDGVVDLAQDDQLVGSRVLPGLHATERVEVHLFVGDAEYVGTSVWPDDYLSHGSVQQRLTWDPPLPAWDGSP